MQKKPQLDLELLVRTEDLSMQKINNVYLSHSIIQSEKGGALCRRIIKN